MADAHHQTDIARGVDPGDDYDLLARRNHQVACLIHLLGQPMHDRQRCLHGTFHRWLLHAQPEQAWRNRVATVAFASRYVVALFQHLQHAKNFSA